MIVCLNKTSYVVLMFIELVSFAENEAKPIYVYNNTERQEAVIGGYVYRGSAFPSAWKGNYIFGDLIGCV